MRNILIIYPHWPPSNLAGVHRPRLISNYLPEFNWHPTVLAVDPKYYEEKPDWDLLKTVSPATEVIHVKAFQVTRPRIIGDIGLRAFWHIYQAAKYLLKERKIDFIWIPIPSFYMALMGRLLYEKFKIPYGIDYIDPWVRDISGRKDWRHWLSNLLARILEPMAIKKAYLITGVSEEYYKPTLLRNFNEDRIYPPLDQQDSISESSNLVPHHRISSSTHPLIHHFAFPYGFDPHDHEIVLKDPDYPWDNIDGCKPLVYAGAFLPNSRLFIDALFTAIRKMIDQGQWKECFHLFFLGTGNYQGKRISEYAKAHGIERYIHEIRGRFPFLHILNFLSHAFGVMVIGSTEKHYTASKTFQSILSKRPVFSILHQESSAAQIMLGTSSRRYYVGWEEKMKKKGFINDLQKKLTALLSTKATDIDDISTIERFSSNFLSQEFAKRIDLLK